MALVGIRWPDMEKVITVYCLNGRLCLYVRSLCGRISDVSAREERPNLKTSHDLGWNESVRSQFGLTLASLWAQFQSLADTFRHFDRSIRHTISTFHRFWLFFSCLSAKKLMQTRALNGYGFGSKCS